MNVNLKTVEGSARTLYFDIDGTLLRNSVVKPALGEGAFEKAVREAGFRQLVCVSNVLNIIRFLIERGRPPDGLGMIFELCRGAFFDEAWFRRVTTLISDPEHRATFINLSADWWYLDDLAAEFIAREGREYLFKIDQGKRVLVPDPEGDGEEIIAWLRALPRRR